jgi:hypothetical protein
MPKELGSGEGQRKEVYYAAWEEAKEALRPISSHLWVQA